MTYNSTARTRTSNLAVNPDVHRDSPYLLSRYRLIQVVDLRLFMNVFMGHGLASCLAAFIIHQLPWAILVGVFGALMLSGQWIVLFDSFR